ncbi:hypothetical protein B0H16DRAFT_1721297 [Mycena metata]|uniref:Uncharacterized protein n=1 Tax=Mycena metata TaxID=1033252 RepID=A0AAD7J5R7_9AGAR|nr:hypothetical protein B0H16DRAFT_1721297 [Mycena metata]
MTIETLDRSNDLIRLVRLPALRNFYLSSGLSEDSDYLPSFPASTSFRRLYSQRQVPSLSVEWLSFHESLSTRLDRTKHTEFLPHLRPLTFRFRHCVFAPDSSTIQAFLSRCATHENSTIFESFRQIWLAPYRVARSGSSESIPPLLDDSAMATCRELVKQGLSIHVT